MSGGAPASGWTFLVSLPHTVRALQLGLYDVEGRVANVALDGDMDQMVEGLTSSDSPARAALWLGLLSVACVLILLRRVDAPTRI